ncbi:phage virion morphogenesis protein [Pseudomonas sp. NPDC098747]|uniref:phage virion morphogenesis protein n=1 Tax=Pseudomonas sp. NPDC098747 TaxID=3364487 RepID=UPI00383AC291
MADDLLALEDWASGLLDQMEPGARSKLARELGMLLRRSQQQRIGAQRNPDGTPYTPRKPRELRGKQGRIRRKAQMFKKLRTARYLKARGDANAMTVGFAGRVARIARVHQYGLKDRAERNAPEVQYEQRQLLGFSDADRDMIRDALLTHLTA